MCFLRTAIKIILETHSVAEVLLVTASMYDLNFLRHTYKRWAWWLYHLAEQADANTIGAWAGKLLSCCKIVFFKVCHFDCTTDNRIHMYFELLHETDTRFAWSRPSRITPKHGVQKHCVPLLGYFLSKSTWIHLRNLHRLQKHYRQSHPSRCKTSVIDS